MFLEHTSFVVTTRSYICEGGVKYFNQLAAQNDKQEAKDAVAGQCKIKAMRIGKRNIDQCALVLAGIWLVNRIKPELWMKLFFKVNLEPRTRVPFEE